VFGFVRRTFAKSMGLDDADLARPIIGVNLIANRSSPKRGSCTPLVRRVVPALAAVALR
jgi:hypothetical protein